MSSSSFVTVVIPTYNHAHFLREALQSLCAQTFTEWEAVVVNNYSEDDTIAVVESFADPRIRLENFRNNGVIGASRNRGIALARGRYVAFLDSDDTWYPDKLMRCIPYLDKGADLVCHGLRYIGKRKGNMYCGSKRRSTYDALLYEGNCIATSSTMVRKDLVESVGSFSEDPAIATAEDYHLWIKLAKVGASMRFIKDILGEYRIHTGSQSGDVLRQLDSVLYVVKEFLPVDSSSGLDLRMRLRRSFAIAYYSAARNMQRNGQFVKAWPLFVRSLVSWPFYSKIYAAIALNVLGRGQYSLR